jgi:aminoglycoside phosphotransferase (APT) family kinase protein
MRDSATRAAIFELSGTVDVAAATAAWDEALKASAWNGTPVWIHGDMQSGNLLAQDGRLSAVIDFGCLGVGDPACDLMVAWNLFSADARDIFRVELEADSATWARGRGWALSVGLIALPYYRTTNPALARISRFAIEQVLAAHARDGRSRV